MDEQLTEEAAAAPAEMTRVVAEHTPSLYGFLGIFPRAMCDTTLVLTDADGTPHTYYRAASKRHYVLYRAAITGGGAPGGSFHGAQR